MEFVTVTRENLNREHICCAIAGNKDCQAASKKAWLAGRFDDGLVFRKADARGKCFIEYIPAELAWTPVEAEGCMYIDCLWVSGQLAGHGYAARLLEDCVRDSLGKGKRGLVILSADKKRPYLSDPGFLRHLGFQPVDEALPYFRLYWLPLGDAGAPPRFLPCAREQRGDKEDGFTLYYTQQCPFTTKYVPVAESVARRLGLPLQTIRLETAAQAQSAPTPFTTYSLFYRGRFVTHEILSEKRAEKFLRELAEKEM